MYMFYICVIMGHEPRLWGVMSNITPAPGGLGPGLVGTHGTWAKPAKEYIYIYIYILNFMVFFSFLVFLQCFFLI
jgi:hypothetical protein